jgi:hypothetical protein
MTMRGLRRTSLSAALLVAAVASTASAQGRQLFQWTGDVDREVQIVMRGRDVWTRDARNNNEQGRHWERVNDALPRTDGMVVVRLEDGRGDADVVQQPNARNNYTTIVRLRDKRGGADRYRLDAYWRPMRGSWDNRNNGEVYPSNRDGDDDGRYDRGNRGIDNRDRADERGTSGPYRPNSSRSVLHWSGDVDDVLEIRIQNQRVEYRTVSGQQPRGVQVSSLNVPQQRDLTLRVTENQGRGDVRVVQQPSVWNGYTTVLRVNDPQGGYGRYDFDLYW